jgi:hypothetical protein
MNDSSNPGAPQWPRDFDFREAYAEQRELLEGLPAGVKVRSGIGALCRSEPVGQYQQLLRIEEALQGQAAYCADTLSLERSDRHDRA